MLVYDSKECYCRCFSNGTSIFSQHPRDGAGTEERSDQDSQHRRARRYRQVPPVAGPHSSFLLHQGQSSISSRMPPLSCEPTDKLSLNNSISWLLTFFLKDSLIKLFGKDCCIIFCIK